MLFFSFTFFNIIDYIDDSKGEGVVEPVGSRFRDFYWGSPGPEILGPDEL